MRLDRPLEPVAGGLQGLLPLWINPNAIAVFPTMVVKWADKP